MTTLTRTSHLAAPVDLRARLRDYWPMIKSLQTGLLLITGLAGYVSARCPVTSWPVVLALLGSLLLSISGSTILNMVYDRDIDAKMERTAHRPLPAGRVNADEALLVGLALAWLGVGWACALSPLFGTVLTIGIFLDVVVYTMWLKRRTPWSIVWGGISGGMPILAGRALGTGHIDPAGVLLALAVLLWIPTHIVTFSIKYAADYHRAGVPIFPNVYGEKLTRFIIGIATGLAVAVMLVATWLIGLDWGYLRAAIGLGVVLLGLALVSVLHRSVRLNFALFKMASLYMLGSMGLIMVGG